MRLRKLELRDAPLMLEWMHDESVVENLYADFRSKTIDDCNKFIVNSWDNLYELHMAVANADDIYMGTVSLKNIVCESAEFGISMRTIAMGKGYSKYAMNEILKMGFEKKKLQIVYWCVSSNNKRAIRFYNKNGYRRIAITDAQHNKLLTLLLNGGKYTQEQINTYFLYMVKKDD